MVNRSQTLQDNWHCYVTVIANALRSFPCPISCYTERKGAIFCVRARRHGICAYAQLSWMSSQLHYRSAWPSVLLGITAVISSLPTWLCRTSDCIVTKHLRLGPTTRVVEAFRLLSLSVNPSVFNPWRTLSVFTRGNLLHQSMVDIMTIKIGSAHSAFHG